MEPYPFTDAAGRSWHVFDYHVIGNGSDAKKRALPIGDWRAEARAFVPVNRDGPVLVYAFGRVAYHGFPPQAKMLENELHFAKPINASAAERMTGQG